MAHPSLPSPARFSAALAALAFGAALGLLCASAYAADAATTPATSAPPAKAATQAQPAQSYTPMTAEQFCTMRVSQMRTQIDSTDIPDAFKQLAKFSADPALCGCVREQFGTPALLENNEASVTRFAKANAVCSARHMTKDLPARCPELYKGILPLMDHPNPTPKQLAQACTCTNDAMKAHLTSDAIFSAHMFAFHYFMARTADQKNNTHTADQIKRAPDPMELASKQMQQCIVDKVK